MPSHYRQFTLQTAYQISENAEHENVERLFWAADRFGADREAVNEDSRAQRSMAIQRIAMELDARKVPLRHPDIVSSSVGKIRAKIFPTTT